MLDNSLFWDVLIVITSTIEWGILKLSLDEFSDKRRSDLFINSITIFLILITIIFNLINLNPNIKLFIGVMIGFVLYTYSYSDNFRKISILYFTFWTIMLALDAFSISAIVFLNSLDSTSIVLSNNIYRLEVIILSKLLLLI